MEFDIKDDFDFEELKNILESAPVVEAYIEYKGIKYIKEEYCILKSKIEEKITELKGVIDAADVTEWNVPRWFHQIDILQELLNDTIKKE